VTYGNVAVCGGYFFTEISPVSSARFELTKMSDGPFPEGTVKAPAMMEN
jgi:hypothetical protein